MARRCQPWDLSNWSAAASFGGIRWNRGSTLGRHLHPVCTRGLEAGQVTIPFRCALSFQSCHSEKKTTAQNDHRVGESGTFRFLLAFWRSTTDRCNKFPFKRMSFSGEPFRCFAHGHDVVKDQQVRNEVVFWRGTASAMDEIVIVLFSHRTSQAKRVRGISVGVFRKVPLRRTRSSARPLNLGLSSAGSLTLESGSHVNCPTAGLRDFALEALFG